MNKSQFNRCPGHLGEGYDGYCNSCRQHLFDGKKVSYRLSFNYEAENNSLQDNINQLSVSGVQEKLSAILSGNELRLTKPGEHGHYIIKPAPGYKYLRYRNQIPANEHLTMQIASQVFGIKTAMNGLIFSQDGSPAYLTRRFDYDKTGKKINQEDFASLAQKTTLTHGKGFKYTGSYEDAAAILKENVSAWRVEMVRFFKLIVFNYIFGNGDAHLKNFSLQQTYSGDYIMSPAYDLLNTSIHVNDEDFALKEGLMPEAVWSDVYSSTGHPCREDFVTFGNRIGGLPKKIEEVINEFSQENVRIKEMIENSYLDNRTKRMYLRLYHERLQRFLRGK